MTGHLQQWLLVKEVPAGTDRVGTGTKEVPDTDRVGNGTSGGSTWYHTEWYLLLRRAVPLLDKEVHGTDRVVPLMMKEVPGLTGSVPVLVK